MQTFERLTIIVTSSNRKELVQFVTGVNTKVEGFFPPDAHQSFVFCFLFF